jgi:hypothetical protein
MSEVLQGVVRGGKVELIDGPALPDGQRVTVVVADPARPTPEEGTVPTPASPELLRFLEQVRRDLPPLPPSPSGPGRRSAAGMLANDPDFDAVMAEIERDRHADPGREVAG